MPKRSDREEGKVINTKWKREGKKAEHWSLPLLPSPSLNQALNGIWDTSLAAVPIGFLSLREDASLKNGGQDLGDPDGGDMDMI